MSLKHILNTIDIKTKEEIAKIEKESQEEERKILVEAHETAVKQKDKIKADLGIKTEKKITKASRQAGIQIKNKILVKKKDILDDIFAKAVKKLARQESDLKKLYGKLLKGLPVVETGFKPVSTDTKGEIIAVDADIELLKKLGSNHPIKPGLKTPGFKFISATVEIDNTLVRLIEEMRDQCEIEVARCLFEQ